MTSSSPGKITGVRWEKAAFRAMARRTTGISLSCVEVLPRVPVGELVVGRGEGLIVEVPQAFGARAGFPSDLTIEHFFRRLAARLKVQREAGFFQNLAQLLAHYRTSCGMHETHGGRSPKRN